MLTEKENIRISKFLSLVLRHQPEAIGLTLDKQGWAITAELLMQLRARGFEIDAEALAHVVATNSKKRFAFNDDGTKIRASQGHSLPVDAGYAAQEPPLILYHGTAEKNIAAIQKEGLRKMGRLHVHLSADSETAVKVGRRHGKPVVFEVQARKMHDEGYSFFLSENGVWLTEVVPALYVTLSVT